MQDISYHDGKPCDFGDDLWLDLPHAIDGGFQLVMGVPPRNDIREHPTKMDDEQGYPYDYHGNHHIHLLGGLEHFIFSRILGF